MPSTMFKARDLRNTGTELRRLRLNSGLSPEQLGPMVGVSGRTIRRIEAGEVKPTTRVMFALADWAGCEVVDLWPV